VLLNVTGGPDLSLHEMTEVAEYVTQAVAESANIIVGAVVHPRPEAEIRVTLIATGMPVDQPAPPSRGPSTARRPPSTATGTATTPREASPPPREQLPPPPAPGYPEPRPTREPTREVRLPDDADPLDIPPFLRRPR
jgi:cell division protein FtsZ